MVKKVKRLFEEFKPEHYELYLELDREDAKFSGKVVVDGQKTGRPSQRITLHLSGLKTKSAKITKIDKKQAKIAVDVERVNTHRSSDELRIHAKEQLYPGRYSIEIEFSGKISEAMHGIYPCNFELNGKKQQLIATQFESHHAREVFPCIDEPEAKAIFGLTLVTPAGETVISNTPIRNQKNKSGQVITVFEPTPIMSTYLLAFAYGDLDYKETKSSRNINVRVYATPDKAGLTDFALNVAARCLDFFEEYYSTPYPLPKLDLIGLPDFSAGAMENWGLITFRESVLYVDPKSSSIETKQVVAMVICHEIAHMWFGNLVTMKWWNDLWLNESFANLMEYRAVDELFPEWKIWEVFVQREVTSALSRDALPNVQAVQTQVNHPDELAAVFDPSIVYAKGGSLLNMVRHLVGEDSFKRGLKSYFQEFKYSNTQADDLWQHLGSVSGLPIGDIMQNWLQKPGFPVVELEYVPKSKEFEASQQRLVLGEVESANSTVWQVPLAASLKTNSSMLKVKSQKFKIEAESDYPLILNHDGHSYLVTQYLDAGHFENILQSVENKSLSSIDRLLLVQNYLLLERALKVSTKDNLKLLTSYSAEDYEPVWGMLAGIIGNVRTLIDKDRPLEDKLNSYVRPLFSELIVKLGWQAQTSETAQTQKLRALILSLAAAAEEKGVVQEGLKRFQDFSKPADLPPDIRSVVYYIGARYGTVKDFNKLVKLHNRLMNAEDKDDVASELTATRGTEKIKSLLSMIKSDNVRLQDAPTWFAWLIRNRYSNALAWQWLIDNWSWVEEKYADDKSYDRFPRYAAMGSSSEQQLQAFRDFFEPKRSIALERPINLGIEEIQSRIAWREKNEQAVKEWLKKL
ncbi:MAG TPA: M1 family metallopeptidase [Candidatus Babeliales bacterium]|nr:M1 family metallopeptidase [Candidatus Babeliales bacterium]